MWTRVPSLAIPCPRHRKEKGVDETNVDERTSLSSGGSATSLSFARFRPLTLLDLNL